MKKKSSFYSVLAAALLVSVVACKKEGNNNNPQVTPSANVLVVNAAPVPAGSSALEVYVDTGKFTSAGLAYLANNQGTAITGNVLYQPIVAGTRTLDIRSANAPTQKLAVSSLNFDVGQNYSLFIYDTLNTTTGQFKVLRLTDNLTPPTDTLQSKVRFLHLAPNAPAVDVTFIRLNGTTEVDSVTFANQTYVGMGAPNEAALSAFNTMRGGLYRVRVKAAGTGNVLATINNSTTTNFLNFAAGKGYTVYVSGTAKGQPLALRSVRHF